MDATNRKRRRAKKDIPKVPIETYKWEDIRRARRRGGYPWTHFTKPPFDEWVDPEQFTLEAFRRSRSAPILRKSSTSDFSEMEELSEKMEQPVEKHNGVPEEKENVSLDTKPSTSSPEPKPTVSKAVQPIRSRSEEPSKKRKLSMESGGSKLGFMLNLGKLKEAKRKLKVPKLVKSSKSDAKESEAKKPKVTPSEPKGQWAAPPQGSPVYIHIPLKPPPGETDEFSKYEFESPGPSSHSGSLTQLQRIGSGRKMSLLGLLAQIKQLQSLKLASESQPQDQEKIKTPENVEVAKLQQSPSKDREKKETVTLQEREETKPLEEKKETETPEETKVPKEEPDKAQKPEETEKKVANRPQTEPLVESYDSAKSENKVESGKGSESMTIEELGEDYKKSPKSDKSGPKTPEPLVSEPEESSNEDNISQYLDKDDKCEVISEVSESTSQAGPSAEEVVEKETDPEKIRKIEATLALWKKQVPPFGTVTSFRLPRPPVQQEAPTLQRARSEEPKHKRKASLERSQSRRSLSKDAVIKRLKEAKDKIKFPKFPSFSKADKKAAKKPVKAEEVKKPAPKLKLEPQHPETPVYIHIPLKPPPGQTDEFSYLSEEPPKQPEPEQKPQQKSEEVDSSVPTSPEIESSHVHLIILTPPSDDEILDPKMPETPSESEQTFFESLKIDDLKNLAKQTVDEVCPETIKLETVTEDEGSDEQSAPESSQEVWPKRSRSPTPQVIVKEPSEEDSKEEPEALQKRQQLFVDEEDGLKLSDAAIAMINEELAKEEQALREKAEEAKAESDREKGTAEQVEPNGVTEKPESEKVKKATKTKGKKKKSTKDTNKPDKKEAGSKDEKAREEIKTEEHEKQDDKAQSVTKPEAEENKEPKEDDKAQRVTKPEAEENKQPKQNDKAQSVTKPEAEKNKEPKEDEECKSSSKKVSFEQKTKTENGEKIYEDVALSGKPEKESSHPKLKPLESLQSMSTDEEKSYLDKKVIKDTSLEEDYNKWSELNDHEYEPVNPPPEEITKSPPVAPTQKPESERPIVQIPSDEKLIVSETGKSDDNLSVQEMQRRIEDRFLASTPETRASSRTDGELHTSQADSSTLETLPLKRESRKKPKTKQKSFNETLRTQADKIKTKLQGIKKPTIPKFSSAKLKKPNFKMPKMPQRPSLPSIHLPSFSSLRKDSAKDSWKERQFSTESNAGDSTKKIFDFRTYPRIFDRHKRKESTDAEEPEFATVPRSSRKKGPLGSRWGNKSKDTAYVDENAGRSKESEGTPDVIRIPLHPEDDPMDVPSHTRYNEDIDNEDEFERENREMHSASPFSRDYLKRWEQGEFHQPQSPQEQEIQRNGYRGSDLDHEEQQTPLEGSFDIPPKEEHSSGSLSERRQGVLEEIDSDEFFLREKGISQEDIEVGKYLSSEIREAFRNPVNALSQLQSEDREYDLDISDQSEPIPEPPRRKPLRKPKRKKTPHVSREQISFDSVTEPEEYPKPLKTFVPPTRPKRKGKTRKNKQENEDVVPYQETIPIEEQFTSALAEQEFHESQELLESILQDAKYIDEDTPQMYENEHMKGIEQPDIQISDPYYRYENYHHDIDKLIDEKLQEPPVAPKRRHRNRSARSLTPSEQGSIAEELKIHEVPQEIEVYRVEHEYIIPTPEPPKRPSRTRSRTRSQSGSVQEDDRTSHGAESLTFDMQPEPCTEIPCELDIRDTMGYAVIDKSRVNKEPPLPPSRFPTTPPPTPPPPRKKRGKKSHLQPENKFFTVPRATSEGPPVRPVRNYSTLGGSGRLSRTSRSKSPSILEEGKENINLCQYIEIEEEEPGRRLQSGEVIQKMRDRPLPAPPRPPRRPRGPTREVFRDISHERNLPPESFEKAEAVSAQTDEDRTHDSILADLEQQILQFDHEETVTHGALVIQPIDNAEIIPRSQLSTPTGQSVEHHIPIVQENQPSEESRKIQEDKTKSPVEEEEDDETSEIPEEFKQLKDPTPVQKQDKIPEPEETSEVPEEFKKLRSPPPPPVETRLEVQEVGLLKTQRMQVSDLDVDRLRVNELQANKIVVSELEGVSLQVTEINSRSGNLVVSGIELPPSFIQEVLDRLQSQAQTISSSESTVKPESAEQSQAQEETAEVGQKKTPFEDLPLVSLTEAPPVPPRHDSKSNLLEEKEFKIEEESKIEEEPKFEEESKFKEDSKFERISFEEEPLEAPPIRPPRKASQPEKVQVFETSSLSEILLEESQEVSSSLQEIPLSVLPPESLDSLPHFENTSKSEEEPPPRPPQPFIRPDSDYLPSQPPSSFYTLRSPVYGDEEDIPLPPRRKRHHKPPPVSRSSSEDVPPAPRRHHKSPEPSIPQMTGQLVRACATELDRSTKRLISHITNNVLQNADGKQDLHVMILIMLVLIAGLILLGGNENVVHHHHWEFFNPPKEL